MSKHKTNTPNLNLKNSYLNLPNTFYTNILPDRASSPKLIIFNEELSKSMGLPFSTLTNQEKADLLSGNQIPNNIEPFSQAYAGHQFGHFTILGDGRAHILGEHLMPNGTHMDIQFKGSGKTPYSRRGDGRAALGPMLREYIISETMHALGIPTTRSLAVVTTGEDIIRETVLPGAILTRIASSHIRVGTFEYAATKRDPSIVKQLLDYTANRHFPTINHSNQKAIDFLNYTIERQIDLIIHWMRVGFIHGVMNTDNMAISGETIDYGPCAFMDTYNPATVFSSIDHGGRYSFGNQPAIAQWNLTRLAEALLPLIDQDQSKAIERAQEIIGIFKGLYQTKWLDMMRSKLGLLDSKPGDEQLITDLLEWMKVNETDYTNTFRDLSQLEKPSGKLYERDDFNVWYTNWQDRLTKSKHDQSTALCVMKQNNPAIIARNHNIEEALEDAVEGNLNNFQNLLAALKNPYEDTKNLKSYQSPPKPSDRAYQTFCGT